MKKICVIFGGKSAEHDISIITGMQLAKNIQLKYDIEKIYLGLDNKFYLATNQYTISAFQDKENLHLKQVYIINNAVYSKGLFFKKLFDIDCVINCCHGGVGENGDLAGFFEVNGVKCTSASSLASHIAMDKSLTKSLVKDFVNTIDGVKVTKSNFEEMIPYIKENLNEDLIVKPNSLGSSIGVAKCNKENFVQQINAIFLMNDDVLVENRVVDLKEYNQAAIMTKEGLLLSMIEEPITKGDFLSFDDKYHNQTKSKGTDRIIPAKISPELEEQIIDATSKIYTNLNMSGVVRIDYIFDTKNNRLYFNEINTIPGSMAYYLFEPLSIDYISLVDLMIEHCRDIKNYSYFDTAVLTKKLL